VAENRETKFSGIFRFEKVAKNTIKFEERPELGQPPRIGTLYIQKRAFGHKTPPQEIRLTVEFETNGQKQ